MTSLRPLLLLCFGVFIETGMALQLAATAAPRDPSVGFSSSSSSMQREDGGILQAVGTRLREDFQGLKALLPQAASSTLSLGLLPQEQQSVAPDYLNANPSEQQQKQAKRDLAYTVLFQAIFMAAFAMLYESYKVRPAVDPVAAKDMEKLNGHYESGFCDCTNDTSICLVGACCPFILWADNMHLINAMAFWSAVCVMILLFAGNAYIPLFFIITVCIHVWGRSQIRRKFNMPFNTMGVLLEDCFLMLCCSTCLMCQDARQLDAACKAGHPAVAEEKEQL